MSNPRVILTTGLPASGKTTLARQMVADSDGRMRRVNLDDLRRMLDGDRRGSRDDEQAVLRILERTVTGLVDDGYDVVVDNTQLQRRIPNMLRAALAGRAEFEVRDLTDVPVEECVKRDAERERPVGEEQIRRMWRDHQRARRNWQLTAEWMNDYVRPEPYVPDASLPAAVLVDIDGTLALHHGRGPYDFDRCGEDRLNTPVADTVRLYSEAGYVVVLLSGRSGDYRRLTEAWLTENAVDYDELWMRHSGDQRRDDVVKAQLFDAHVRERFAVTHSIDDRTRVVGLWRRMGISCWQVAPGDF